MSLRPDGKAELWLADVTGAGGFDWTAPRLARFAYELGAGQGRWARSAARGDLERASCARDTDAVSRLRRLTGLVALIADWAHSALA